jgi:hypothetical protein
MTPTQRTMKALRKKGFTCAIVEKWNPYAKRGPEAFGIRQDLFGFIDILALDWSKGVIGVQSTGVDFSGHHKKLIGERRENCIRWLLTPGCFLELWAWRKIKKVRGGKQMIYKPRIKLYTLEDFDFEPTEEWIPPTKHNEEFDDCYE